MPGVNARPQEGKINIMDCICLCGEVKKRYCSLGLLQQKEAGFLVF